VKQAPERYRMKGVPPPVGDPRFNGAFIIPHYKIDGYFFCCIVSNGLGWEHVSITLQTANKCVERCCTWQEMCFIKTVFWEDEESVMQLHPPKSQYVSTHPYCLHLWRPLNNEIPLPNPLMVGFPGDNKQS